MKRQKNVKISWDLSLTIPLQPFCTTLQSLTKVSYMFDNMFIFPYQLLLYHDRDLPFSWDILKVDDDDVQATPPYSMRTKLHTTSTVSLNIDCSFLIAVHDEEWILPRTNPVSPDVINFCNFSNWKSRMLLMINKSCIGCFVSRIKI